MAELDGKSSIEIWKDIEGYEGQYQVSNFGRVKNNKKAILKISIIKKTGYCLVSLKRKQFYLHRIVALAFIPNPSNYSVVNHKDEDKTNNFVWINEDGTIDPEKSNLEWCTQQHNIQWGTAQKRRVEKRSKLVPNRSKPVKQIDYNGNTIATWQSASEAARMLNMHQVGISRCCLNKVKYYRGYVWKFASNINSTHNI